MKGQLILEFVIAGLIFFMIIVYTINYLNMNVADFKSKFYQSYLQTKAIQVSEVLMGDSSLSLMGNSEFDMLKIQSFGTNYCNPSGNYNNLVKELHLYQKTEAGFFPNDIIIKLDVSGGETLLDCGPRTIPRNTTRAEIGRFGLLDGDTANLRIIVW